MTGYQTRFKPGHTSCNFVDEVGNRYGKLVVIARMPNSQSGHSRWECQCDCGRRVTRQGVSLRYAVAGGKVPSCVSGRRCPQLERTKGQTDAQFKRATRLKREYDLTEEDFDCLWIAGYGRCFICSKRMIHPTEESGRRCLDSCCIDHNHTTGNIRGLLCNACNKGIGLLQDNPLILKKALEYLQ